MSASKMSSLRLSGLAAGVIGAALAGCSPKAVEGQSQVIEGVKFDYGLVAEQAGGAPAHPNSYHVVLSVADAQSGRKLEPVEVGMSLSGPGHPGKSRVAMDPMTVNGQASYGRYVVLPERGPYQLEFQVRPSGEHQPIRARFKLDRPA